MVSSSEAGLVVSSPGGLLLQVDVLPHRHGTQPAARGEMEDLQVLPQLSILALKI